MARLTCLSHLKADPSYCGGDTSWSPTSLTPFCGARTPVFGASSVSDVLGPLLEGQARHPLRSARPPLPRGQPLVVSDILDPILRGKDPSFRGKLGLRCPWPLFAGQARHPLRSARPPLPRGRPLVVSDILDPILRGKDPSLRGKLGLRCPRPHVGRRMSRLPAHGTLPSHVRRTEKPADDPRGPSHVGAAYTWHASHVRRTEKPTEGG